MKPTRSIAFCLFSLMAAGAWAQPVITQTGNALDANPSLGGRGNPTAAPSQYGSASQYLITGEARMGRSFQGFMPYSASNQFQSRLGSSSLYNFERDSASLPTVLQGGNNFSTFVTQQPTADTSRSTFGASRVSQSVYGGESTGVLNPFAQPTYRPPGPTRPEPGIDLRSPLLSETQLPSLSLTDQLAMRKAQIDQAQRDSLPADSLFPSALSQFAIGREASADPKTKGTLADQLKVNPLNPKVEPDRTDPSRDLARDPAAKPTGEPADSTPADPAQTDLQHAVQFDPGQDLYADLIRRADQMRQTQAKPAQPKPSPTPAATPPAVPDAMPPSDPTASPAPRPTPAPGEGVNVSRDALGDMPSMTGPAPAVLNLGVSRETFASAQANRQNALIREGEALLAAGEFYRGGTMIEQAGALDARNPLIWLRASQAYFGAGEFASSGRLLMRSIRLFPSVVSVRTPLLGLTGEAGDRVLETRLAQLQRLAQRSDSVELWTLLCYVQHLTGRSDAAAGTAEFLAKRKADSPQAAAVAQFVLGARSATTRPN